MTVKEFVSDISKDKPCPSYIMQNNYPILEIDGKYAYFLNEEVLTSAIQKWEYSDYRIKLFIPELKPNKSMQEEKNYEES